jgi:hypothetical protein
MDDGLSIAADEIDLGIAGNATAALQGEPFGCFRNNSTGDFVYYHVLVER